MKPIVVMSELMAEMFKEQAFSEANKYSDPIAFLKWFNSIEIVINNDYPLGIVELWDKDTYEAFMKLEGDE